MKEVERFIGLESYYICIFKEFPNNVKVPDATGSLAVEHQLGQGPLLQGGGINS